jgi:hypothetical protein
VFVFHTAAVYDTELRVCFSYCDSIRYCNGCLFFILRQCTILQYVFVFHTAAVYDTEIVFVFHTAAVYDTEIVFVFHTAAVYDATLPKLSCNQLNARCPCVIL